MYSIYTFTQGALIHSRDVKYRQYPDDSQIYISIPDFSLESQSCLFLNASQT